MRPHAQGSLDGLCAVYSIVNAARIVSQIDEDESRALFRRIIRYLESTRSLPEVLTDGIGLTTVGGILKDVVDDTIPHRRMPFKGRPHTSLDSLWSEMGEFLDGGSHRAVMLSVSGPVWDHWSIVRSVSDKQLCFFDSHKLRRLNRSRCTTARVTTRRPHVLSPTHAYFFS